MIDPEVFNQNTEVNFHGTKGMVYIEDRILVFRRDKNTNRFPLQVDLPGGGREGNESPFENFKRELEEEFGLKITEQDVIYAKKYPSIADPNISAYFFVIKNEHLKEKDVIFGSEGLYFQLLTPEEFLNLPDGVQRQQKKVLDYINKK